MDLLQLKTDLPAAYYALVCLAMSGHAKSIGGKSHAGKSIGSLQNLSADNLIKNIPQRHVYWQQLKLSDKTLPESTPAEIVAVIINQELHLLYFQLSIEPLFELAAKDFSTGCKAYSELLFMVLDKLKNLAKKHQCKQIISDVYNPHIQQLLKQSGFTIEWEEGNNPIMPSKRLVLVL